MIFEFIFLYFLGAISTAYVAMLIGHKYDWDWDNIYLIAIMSSICWPLFFPVLVMGWLYVQLFKLAEARA